jgi:hypothetical protein
MPFSVRSNGVIGLESSRESAVVSAAAVLGEQNVKKGQAREPALGREE